MVLRSNRKRERGDYWGLAVDEERTASAEAGDNSSGSSAKNIRTRTRMVTLLLVYTVLSVILISGLLFATAGFSANKPNDGPAGASTGLLSSLNATTTFLVSLDGFRPEYLERGLTPTLEWLANTGVMARALQPAFPTLTFPNHVTLVTGRHPGRHGITNNIFYDATLNATFSYSRPEDAREERWWRAVQPLWLDAEDRGLVTAIWDWPGSLVERPKRRGPSHVRGPYDPSVSARTKIQEILQLLDDHPETAFVALYISDIDSAGHDHGPHSREVASEYAGTLFQLVR